MSKAAMMKKEEADRRAFLEYFIGETAIETAKVTKRQPGRSMEETIAELISQTIENATGEYKRELTIYADLCTSDETKAAIKEKTAEARVDIDYYKDFIGGCFGELQEPSAVIAALEELIEESLPIGHEYTREQLGTIAERLYSESVMGWVEDRYCPCNPDAQ